MKYRADLHLHSHYSRATSKNLNLEHLSKWAQLKGIHLVGTADFVHPGWLDELKEKLQPAEEGFFELKPEFAKTTAPEVPAACRKPVRFMLSAEISNIYKRHDKVRKIHNVIFAPGFDAAEDIQAKLDAIGNIRSDGRPILGLDSHDLLEIVLESHKLSFLIPAHIWTPWFSMLGSKGGFDSVEACFGDLTPHIFAVETGLSSDPPMNWRLQQLDPYVLVSNSDAHSPANLAREATLFDTEFSYPGLYRALSAPEDAGLTGTIEFFPEEGKYHFDGHRNCNARLHPRETLANNGLCPKCGKPVTVGVMARVEELADRPADSEDRPPRSRPYYSLIPLAEIIAEAKNKGPKTKGVLQVYHQMLAKLGDELFILQEAPLEDIRAIGGTLVAEGVRRVRAREVHIAAGYDGEYGTIRIFEPAEREDALQQAAFFPDTPARADTRAAAEKIEQPAQETQQGATKPAGEILKLQIDDAESAATQSPAVRDVTHGLAAPPHPEVPDLQLGMQLPEDLNSAQWRAVTHTGSHLLIVAGPGTGKTHTLTYRVAHVAQCFAASENILAVTFTNKAAGEMKERLLQRLGDEAKHITVETFHSFCLQLLRRFAQFTGLPEKFVLASPEEIEMIARELWPDATSRREHLRHISRLKARWPVDESDARLQAYNRALRAPGLIDFDDLLLEALRLLQSNETVREQITTGYRFIFVDEYQDINGAQHALLKALVREGVQLTAIGDPNQAIYGFRGADVRYFSTFQEDFPGAQVLHLADNYRSAEKLLTASGQVIRPAQTTGVPVLTAKFYADGRLTIHEAVTEKAEAEYVVHQIEKMLGGTSMFSQDSGRVDSEAAAERSFGDFAVLYRLNQQRAALEEAFERSGMPYQVSGDRPLISQPAVAEILALLQIANDAAIPARSASALLQLVIEGFGGKTGERLEEKWKAAGQNVDLALLQGIQESAQLPDRTTAANYTGFLSDLHIIRGKLRDRGLIAALQHLIVLPQWQRVFSRDTAARESWQRLIRLARLNSGLGDFLDCLRLQRENDMLDATAEKVALLTLHAAKGLEFSVVFITGCEQGLLPLEQPGRTSDPAEERRLFYVGMTRAREQLFLVRAKKRLLYGKQVQLEPSPFLADIQEELKAYEAAVVKSRPPSRRAGAAQLDLFGA